MDTAAKASLTEKVTEAIKKLRNPGVVGNQEYYKLIKVLRDDLYLVFKDTTNVIEALLISINAQYKIYEDKIPSSHHVFELNVMRTLKLDGVNSQVIPPVLEHILRRLFYQKETYPLLTLLQKIVGKFIVKDRETELLRKLQALVNPSNKHCVRIVNEIVECILTDWDTPTEQRFRFEELMLLSKWTKLEFYVCKTFYKKYVTTRTVFENVLTRIFHGFQENHTAYAAHMLFEFILSTYNGIFYNVLENDVVGLLQQDNEERKTLHSSLITYVIPSMVHHRRAQFIKRTSSFKPIYMLHTIKSYYLKKYTADINLELIEEIRKKHANKQAIISLVWELCCTFLKAERFVSDQHLRLFMNCIRYHYNESDVAIQDHIHTFLSQVAISMITTKRPIYIDFFEHLTKLVKTVLTKITLKSVSRQLKPLVDVHTKATFLMSRSYLALRPKFSIPDDIKYNELHKPLTMMHEAYITGGWSIVKFYVRCGVGYDCLYGLIDPYRIEYDASFVYATRLSLIASLTNPNLEQLERIRTYTKILIKMYKDYSRTVELETLMSDIMDVLLCQYGNVKDMANNLIYLANPLYTSGEALHIITKEYGEENLHFIFNVCDEIIKDTLQVVEKLCDVHSRKFIEQIFITHIQLLKTCIQKFFYTKPEVGRFLHLCEQVMCVTKFRKATTVAFNAALSTIKSCRGKPLYEDITRYLTDRLSKYLAEVEQVAINRCSGNKEMLLLTFKTLIKDPALFATHFEKLINVSQGHQELYLVALETICGDGDLKDLTAPFLVQVFRNTIGFMAHPMFSSRNAATQLIQVLANRFMGTKSELGERPISVLQAFEYHPELQKICSDALDETNNNSKFGVLCFIGDSPHNSTIFGESYNVPKKQLKELMTTPGLKMLATRAFAMATHSQYLSCILCDSIEELKSGNITPCNFLFAEYLLERLINSFEPDSQIQDAIQKFENLLDCPLLANFPDAKKYLRYPNCKNNKLDLHHKKEKHAVEEIISFICKCLFLENFVALSFLCFYVESIFHRLEDGSKRTLLQKLFDVFTQFNGSSDLMNHQYYSSIKKLLTSIPSGAVINIVRCDICHIFVAEIITFILRERDTLSDCQIDILRYVKDNLPILIDRCDNFDEELSTSIIDTLVNLLYLFPKEGFPKSDFYYVLFIALFQISDKNKFAKLLRVITNGNHSISRHIQYLPLIIRKDLGVDYGVFIKSIAKYVSSNLNRFFITYPCLYNCPEEYVNVKIDIFLLKMVLEDVKNVL